MGAFGLGDLEPCMYVTINFCLILFLRHHIKYTFKRISLNDRIKILCDILGYHKGIF
jgi:hypothetical protein